MKRVYEFILSLLRRAAKPAVAVPSVEHPGFAVARKIWNWVTQQVSGGADLSSRLVMELDGDEVELLVGYILESGHSPAYVGPFNRLQFAGVEIKPVFKKTALEIPSACPWTQQDQSNLKAFLLSASGQRFIRKCHVLEYANAISGCDAGKPDYSYCAGLTAGCRDLLTFIVGELAVNFDKPEVEPPVEERHDETVEEFLGRVSP